MNRRATLLAATATLTLATSLWAHRGLQSEIERRTQQLRLDPESVELLAERGRSLRAAGLLEESLVDLKRAFELDHHNAQAALQLGLTLSALRRDDQAKSALMHALDLNDRSALAYAELGAIRVRNGRADLAVFDFDAALEIEPRVETFLAQGSALESLGRLAEAAATYQSGVDRTGADTIVRALIRVQVARGHHEEALALIENGAERAAVKTRWLLARAFVLDSAGKAAEARRARRRALLEAGRRVAERATALTLTERARTRFELGYRDAARADLVRALQLTRDYAPAVELLEKLSLKTLAPVGPLE